MWYMVYQGLVLKHYYYLYDFITYQHQQNIVFVVLHVNLW